ncbi:Sm protein [Histomonas meleagridis]|nr:Sm protein [Histomonas meleagridis]
MILRGDSVVHVDVIGPPPPTGNKIATSTSSTTHQPGVPHDKNASAQKSTNMPKPAQTTGIVNSSMKAAPSVLPPSALPQ